MKRAKKPKFRVGQVVRVCRPSRLIARRAGKAHRMTHDELIERCREVAEEALPCSCGKFEQRGKHHLECAGYYHYAVAEAFARKIEPLVEALEKVDLALPHLPLCNCDMEVGYQCAQCFIEQAIRKAALDQFRRKP